MGKIIQFFQVLPRFLESFLIKPQTWAIILLVAGTITFISVSKSQKAQQRALVRKVKKVKAAQRAYNRELDENKLPKLKDKYDKAYKRLKKRINYALWWNRKRIVLTSPLLTDESENANLALKGCPAFTFKDVLNNLLDEKNKKRKHKTQIIEKNKTISKLKTEKKNKNDEVKQQEQSFERLKQPPYHVNSVNTDKQEGNNVEKKNSDNLSSIYQNTDKSLENEKIL